MADAPRKGLVIVYTGDGKGKTSAALGGVLRALGHGWRVLVIQFFKGEWPVVFGELESAKHHDNLEILQLGRGFVGIMGDKKPLEEHRAAAQQALETARLKMCSGRYDLVVLDEINCAIDSLGVSLVPLSAVLELIDSKPERTHLVLTGRNARPEIIGRADLVTEMKQIKHPFQAGIPAQIGIDY
ncbi:MAG: Cob(I)yrinic acid a,c-diamide adenosyltransferase [Candidatus Omnitrophica bacterium]|nr:Cob(I)yrinic acid a,c-diamide adenosyltransferase [Candidatus Omnitrophota bacterium]